MFRDVQRLVAEPAHARERGQIDFDKTLAGVAQEIEGRQVVKSVVETHLQPPAPAPKQVALADPQLKLAPLDAIRVPSVPVQPEVGQQEQPSESVRSPTLVSAKRVSTPDPYMGLTRAEREEAVASLVRDAGARHGVDPVLSFAVVAVESSFNPRAVSSDGHESKGLMQLLDSTGRAQLRLSEGANAYDPFHPPLNVDLGVRYLRDLHDMFSQPTKVTNDLTTVAAANSSSLEKLAVASYNAGQGRVAAAQQRADREGKNPGVYSEVEAYLPQSTQEYVRRVMDRREHSTMRFGVSESEKEA